MRDTDIGPVKSDEVGVPDKACRENIKAKENIGDEETKYSIVEDFTASNGTHFENAVLLDTAFFDGISPRNW